MQLLVKDFAKSLGVSESIIYRHIRNHREALGDRIIKKAKQTWVTDEGQEYIKNLMVQPLPPVVGDADQARELAELRQENTRLQNELTEAYKRVAGLSQTVGLLEGAKEREQAAQERENQLRETLIQQQKDFAEEKAGLKKERDSQEARADQAEREREATTAELDKVRKHLPWQLTVAAVVGVVFCLLVILVAGK